MDHIDPCGVLDARDRLMDLNSEKNEFLGVIVLFAYPLVDKQVRKCGISFDP